MSRACGHRDCAVSTTIAENLSFGRGDLDYLGFWEIACEVCARDHERRHPEDGECWPPPGYNSANTG